MVLLTQKSLVSEHFSSLTVFVLLYERQFIFKNILPATGIQTNWLQHEGKTPQVISALPRWQAMQKKPWLLKGWEGLFQIVAQDKNSLRSGYQAKIHAEMCKTCPQCPLWFANIPAPARRQEAGGIQLPLHQFKSEYFRGIWFINR